MNASAPSPADKPASSSAGKPAAQALTPTRIVAELDKYIVGQTEAKKAVAIAIRNRWRRMQLPPELRDEVPPKNILMIGPTGVGKTEIARRLAQLVGAPFIKVEATRYTEVGYHGRDVESMIRDLAEAAFNLVKREESRSVEDRARAATEERLLDLLLPRPPRYPAGKEKAPEEPAAREGTREKLRAQLREGKLDKRQVELVVEERHSPVMEIFTNAGMGDMAMDFSSALEKMSPPQHKQRKVSIDEARVLLLQQEIDRLLDKDKLTKEAVFRAENSGIIFLDEIDKVVGSKNPQGPDVSREGVQRDLLPIVEGATVLTRYGPVKSDFILFIAAGAFHASRPSELIPELQGRFPIRVELSSLGGKEFRRILSEPKNALIKQYQALLSSEGVDLVWQDDALDEIASMAERANQQAQDIGARRLHTIFEKLLEEISFDAPDRLSGTVTVDRDYVLSKLANILENEDLSKYIL